MRAISAAIIALTGAVILLTASQLTHELPNKTTAGLGGVVLLVGLITWAVCMFKLRD
jgi:hypothetical protein